MGLGASWVGKSQPGGGPTGIAATGTRRLRNSLRIEDRSIDQRDCESSDEGSEDESRARLTNRRVKNKKKKRKPVHTTENGPKEATNGTMQEGTKDGPVKHGPVNGAEASCDAATEGREERNDWMEYAQNDVSDGNTAVEIGTRADMHWMEAEANEITPEGAQANGGYKGMSKGLQANGIKKKKRKIRSRQKNLRKDKRPKHLLPAHLTDESLRNGRVRRMDSPTSRVAVDEGE